MKDREALYQEIIDETSPSLSDMYVAVDSTTYAILEYIEEIAESFKHYTVMNQVVETLKKNVKQFLSGGSQ